MHTYISLLRFRQWSSQPISRFALILENKNDGKIWRMSSRVGEDHGAIQGARLNNWAICGCLFSLYKAHLQSAWWGHMWATPSPKVEQFFFIGDWRWLSGCSSALSSRRTASRPVPCRADTAWWRTASGTRVCNRGGTHALIGPRIYICSWVGHFVT